MSIDRQTGDMYQGTHRTLTVAIPIGSSGYDHTDVSAASMAMVAAGAAVLTKTLAAAEITVTTVSTNIVLSCALVPADTSSLAGVYRVEWIATIDGLIDVRATGTITVIETALA